MIKFENNHHWYASDGTPQHDADLRVARKKFLYPSVTTIDKDVFKNDFLDRWKMNELVNAAASTFKQPHETPEDYANRIYEDSLTKARTAADFGKKIHDAIEKYPEQPVDERLNPWIDRFGKWYGDSVGEVVSRESILVDHDLGVAGRCDFIAHGKGRFEGRIIIPDWKTQNVKTDKKGRKIPAFYESWTRQLAFYAVSYAKQGFLFPTAIPTCISLVFDSNEPGEPFEKVWGEDEIRDNYYDFVAGAYLWFSKRGYWPQPRGKFTLNPSIPMP